MANLGTGTVGSSEIIRGVDGRASFGMGKDGSTTRDDGSAGTGTGSGEEASSGLISNPPPEKSKAPGMVASEDASCTC